MKNNKDTTIGQRVKHLRETKGLTQTQLGEILFVSDKTISKWEKDNSEPDSASLVRIAEYFNVTLDYLLTGNNPSIDDKTISKIELACRDDSIALLDGVDLDAFDDKGKNIEYYLTKYRPHNVQKYISERYINETADKQNNKTYCILGLAKDNPNGDYRILDTDVPYEEVTSRCHMYNEDVSFDHLKILSPLSVDEKIEKDYQYFFTNILDVYGKKRMTFSVALFDDLESGLLYLNIDKLPNSDGGFRGESYTKGTRGYFYIKPSAMKAFLDLLNELDFKNLENKHWGIQFTDIFFALHEKPTDDDLTCHKFYIDPGIEKYEKFIKGIHQLFLECLPHNSYKVFVDVFQPRYDPYYRNGLVLVDSIHVFKEIEKEMREISSKHFEYKEYWEKLRKTK